MTIQHHRMMVCLPPWRCVSLLPRPRTASGTVTRTRPVLAGCLRGHGARLANERGTKFARNRHSSITHIDTLHDANGAPDKAELRLSALWPRALVVIPRRSLSLTHRLPPPPPPPYFAKPVQGTDSNASGCVVDRWKKKTPTSWLAYQAAPRRAGECTRRLATHCQ